MISKIERSYEAVMKVLSVAQAILPAL